jgi:hypothetical protein
VGTRDQDATQAVLLLARLRHGGRAGVPKDRGAAGVPTPSSYRPAKARPPWDFLRPQARTGDGDLHAWPASRFLLFEVVAAAYGA